jgi:hypothetical protein
MSVTLKLSTNRLRIQLWRGAGYMFQHCGWLFCAMGDYDF